MTAHLGRPKGAPDPAFSLEPVANGLQRWVEAGAVSTYRPDAVYDAVIVLGGAVDADATVANPSPAATRRQIDVSTSSRSSVTPSRLVRA